MIRFFPASGYCHRETGIPIARGVNGNYWSSLANSATNGWRFRFNTTGTDFEGIHRTYVLSVRCVAQGVRNYNCFYCSIRVVPTPLHWSLISTTPD